MLASIEVDMKIRGWGWVIADAVVGEKPLTGEGGTTKGKKMHMFI